MDVIGLPNFVRSILTSNENGGYGFRLKDSPAEFKHMDSSDMTKLLTQVASPSICQKLTKAISVVTGKSEEWLSGSILQGIPGTSLSDLLIKAKDSNGKIKKILLGSGCFKLDKNLEFFSYIYFR